MRMDPTAQRSKLFTTHEGLEIAIPMRQNPFQSLFLLFWLGGWGFGEVTVIKQLLQGHGNFFLMAWLGMWTIGGGFVVWGLLWSFCGIEKIIITPRTLKIRNEVFGLGRVKEYDASSITNLRVAPVVMESRAHFAGLKPGTLAFDYGASTVRFGKSIEEGEASLLIKTITSRFPNLAPNQTL